jgi:hypothetical protein
MIDRHLLTWVGFGLINAPNTLYMYDLRMSIHYLVSITQVLKDNNSKPVSKILVII